MNCTEIRIKPPPAPSHFVEGGDVCWGALPRASLADLLCPGLHIGRPYGAAMCRAKRSLEPRWEMECSSFGVFGGTGIGRGGAHGVHTPPRCARRIGLMREKVRICARRFTKFHESSHRSGPWFGFPSPPRDGCPDEVVRSRETWSRLFGFLRVGACLDANFANERESERNGVLEFWSIGAKAAGKRRERHMYTRIELKRHECRAPTESCQRRVGGGCFHRCRGDGVSVGFD
jgi:hypothetical protein